ncbi:phage major capsid protein [Caloranaerobacter sp. DY30410]|uniref:phage major capsid protein n=1 Tax=Caloranaerobacter sp. DY30410 TaxID=3238305 RepID=UPI003CFC851D
MSKELRALLDQLAQLEAEARTLIAQDEISEEEIKAKTEEIRALKAKIEAQKELEAANALRDGMAFDGTGNPINSQQKEEQEIEREYRNAFLKAFRGKKLTAEEWNIIETKNALTESIDADGGLLVPQDVQTAINQYKRALPDLTRLINVIPVTTLSGSRVFEKIATMTPFANITDDTADIDDMGSPQFEKVSYTIKKYAGWMPIPNDLLKDSDQNILDYLSKWIARKSVVTRNTLILNLLGTLTKTSFADYKAIKKAINVTLDPMLSAGAVILTNQDGFQYLDTLEDTNGKPLLQTDITKPSKKMFAGKTVIVVPNTVLATKGTTTKKAPMIVANFTDLITMFERQGHQIASTNIGGTAFRKDRTEIRVIEREDVKLIDTAAAVYGEVDVTDIVG